MVERRLAKAEVAGSSPVSRSTYEMEGTTYPRFINRRHSQAVRQRSAKPSSPVRFRVAPPKKKHLQSRRFFFEYLGNGTCPGEIHSPCAKGSFAANARRMQKRRPAVRGPGLVRQLSLADKTKIGKRPLWLVDFRFHPPRKTKGRFWEGVGNREP